MDITMVLLIAVVVLIAVIAWYEYQLLQISSVAADLLAKLEELSDLATDPPFNLVLDDEDLVAAFKQRLDGGFKSNVTFVEDGTWLEHRNAAVADAEAHLKFSAAEIEEWN